MKFVEMRHAKSKRTATVPESAVPQHEKAGWALAAAEKNSKPDTKSAQRESE